MYKLTEKGVEVCKKFIAECYAQRKEILDAGKDTAEETSIPTIEDIESDLNAFGFDIYGDYYNCWGVTDAYNSDNPIMLTLGSDFTEHKDFKKLHISMAYTFVGDTGIDVPLKLLEGKTEEEQLRVAYRYAQENIDKIHVAENATYIADSDAFELEDIDFEEEQSELYTLAEVETYKMQQHEYDKKDIQNDLDKHYMYYEQNFSIALNPVTETEIDAMARELRRILDINRDVCWSHAKEAAIKKVLSAKQKQK